MLKQNGYWSTKARDFLPLALANWSKRPVQIHTSKQDEPIIEVQSTLGSVCNTVPITLAYTLSTGFAVHYDACKNILQRQECRE